MRFWNVKNLSIFYQENSFAILCFEIFDGIDFKYFFIVYYSADFALKIEFHKMIKNLSKVGIKNSF